MSYETYLYDGWEDYMDQQDYFVTRRELDKASLKDALKAGQEVRGAHLEQTESLRIR